MVSLQKERKESMAFMPTSNDVLYTCLNGHGQPTNTFGTPLTSLSHQQTQIDMSLNSSSKLTPTMSSNDLPREQVASASDVPMSTRLGRDPSDEPYWYDVYLRVLETHTSERELWSMERNKLTADKLRLQEEVERLTNNRNDSAFSGWGKQQLDDKCFPSADMVKESNEKLAEFSVVGGSSVDSSRITTPSGITVTKSCKEHSMNVTPGVRRTSGTTSILSSIAETKMESPRMKKEVPRVTVGGDSTVDAGYGDAITPTFEKENPYSPPTTAAVGSPPAPANYTMFAGHTPLAVRSRSARESFVFENTDSDKVVATQPAPVSALVYGYGDVDPELKSPKVLPTKLGEVNDILDTLGSRLQEVAENPEEHKPEAIKKAESLYGAEDDDLDDDEDASGSPAGKSNSPGGIKLKSSRKMNFGSQLGAM